MFEVSHCSEGFASIIILRRDTSRITIEIKVFFRLEAVFVNY